MDRASLRGVADRGRLLARITVLEKALAESFEALEAVGGVDREFDHQVLPSRVSRLCVAARASARRTLGQRL